MTEPVTRALPPGWQGPYDLERAAEWIAERDREGTTLLVTERSTRDAVGLLILFETETEDRAGIDIRIGYLLAESAWGKGFATELIAGFVEWCRLQGGIYSITGGVALDNPASIRVLEKNGFRPAGESPQDAAGEHIFELLLNR